MNKYEKMISPDETIIHSGHLHYIILVKALLWFAFLVCLSIYIPNIFWNGGKPDLVIGFQYLLTSIQSFDREWLIANDLLKTCVIGLSLLSALLAIIVPIYYTKMYFSRYIITTDNRLVYKTGLLFIHIIEIEIEEIEEVHFNSGVFGALLNYGYIYVDMRFVGDAYIPCIPKPYLFMQAMHKAHDNTHDNFKNILNKSTS